jgi:hypothetical protein
MFLSIATVALAGAAVFYFTSVSPSEESLQFVLSVAEPIAVLGPVLFLMVEVLNL